MQRAWLHDHPAQPEILRLLFRKADAMKERILVTYATRAGSTTQVAAAIAETLTARGYQVDLTPVKENPPVAQYHAVVLGSAVRFGQWLPEAIKFVESNRGALNQMPTAFFAVHILNTGDEETSRAARRAYLDPVRKLVQPKCEAFFAGVGDLAKVSLIERLIGKAVKSPEGDFRDWAAIRGWAETIAL